MKITQTRTTAHINSCCNENFLCPVCSKKFTIETSFVYTGPYRIEDMDMDDILFIRLVCCSLKCLLEAAIVKGTV